MGFVTVGQGLLQDLISSPEQHDHQFAEGEEGQLDVHWNLPEGAPVVWGFVDDFTNQTPGAWREGGITHIPVQKNSPLIVAGIIAGLIIVIGAIIYFVFFEPQYKLLKKVEDKIAEGLNVLGGSAALIVFGAALLLLMLDSGDSG
jgi:hypothetical protein